MASGTWQGIGYFRTICCLSGWKGIGYVLQLFPFCAGLGEPSRLLPARGAGAETGRSGTRYPGTRGRQNQKFMWCWGGPGCRCRALIKPGCGAVGFHSEAREDGLCGMLTGNSCCSCLSRRLFLINITVKIQTSRMFSDIYSNPTAKRQRGGRELGGERNLFLIFTVIWLDLFCGLWLLIWLCERMFADASNFYFNLRNWIKTYWSGLAGFGRLSLGIDIMSINTEIFF